MNILIYFISFTMGMLTMWLSTWNYRKHSERVYNDGMDFLNQALDKLTDASKTLDEARYFNKLTKDALKTLDSKEEKE